MRPRRPVKESEDKARLEYAERQICDRLFRDPWFCYKYQLYRLKKQFWSDLGNDLSGGAFGEYPTNPPSVAADILVDLSQARCRLVVRENKRIPFTEGNLIFATMRLGFLPLERPVVFRSVGVTTIDQLAAAEQVTIEQAANLLVKLVEEE